MPIAAGQIVSPPNMQDFALQERQQEQPPQRGIVTALGIAADCDVLWEDGSLVTGIPTASLDQIVSTALDVTYKGRVCQLQLNSDTSLPQSPTIVCTVVDVYQRARDGGVPDPAVALCRSLTTQAWYELPLSRLQILPGR